MAKDRRYNTVKNLISGGFIKSLNEIYDTIPKSVIAEDLGFNSTRINNLIAHVDRFIAKDLFKLAELIGVDEIEIMKLVCNQHAIDKKARRRK